MGDSSTTLRRRAAELGIDVRYEDVDQVWHDADPTSLAMVVEVLDADAAVSDGPVDPVVIGAARPVTVSGTITDVELTLADGTSVDVELLADPRGAGTSIVLPPDLPFGCHELRVATRAFEGLSTIVVPPPMMPRSERLSGRSGLFVPAYALWDHDHALPSFSLLGRLADALDDLDTAALITLPLYATFLDDPFDPSPYSPASRLHWNECYLDDHTLPEAPLDPQGRYLDWAAVARRRRKQLLTAVEHLDSRTQHELDQFVVTRPDVQEFARFMATRRGDDDPQVERSHVLAQYLAHRQLEAVGRSSGATLAIDLPIGCHPDGFERWAHPELFADRMAIGAPPDSFFAEGQNWGLPPQLPAAGRHSGYRLWRELLTRAGEHASLLRIDHVMAVHRLWWVPDGRGADQGVYVRYPREELLAVIAATAATLDTTVVGEDLGTVPAEVGEALERWQMLGMFEEQFHTDTDPMPRIPERTVAGVRTHDMAPFAAFVASQGRGLDAYRRRLANVVGHEVGDHYHDLLDSVIERLASSDASLVTVDLDDLLGETEPHNVPGRVGDTTWRRRLDRSLTDTMADPELQRRLRLLATRPVARR
jgi:4-alpha-glucanotransferase